MSRSENPIPLPPGDGWKNDEGESFVSLFDANVSAVLRAADCFQNGGPHWNGDGTSSLFDWAFWERLYGPYGDGPQDRGAIEWEHDFRDCFDDEFDYDALDAGISDERRHVLDGHEE